MTEFYDVIFNRRDVRGEFLPDAIDDEVLAKVLTAAHHAPSVGFSQPWNFIVVRNPAIKQQVYELFCHANEEAAQQFTDKKQQQYRQLRLQGITDAPVNIVVTCDRARGGDVVLGRTHQPDMDLYSTACAVQNLWLAARAEELGVGWVSIMQASDLATQFQLPDTVVPIAYLCVGKVKFFHQAPELAERNWQQRLPLSSLIYSDTWGEQQGEEPLLNAIKNSEAWLSKWIKK